MVIYCCYNSVYNVKVVLLNALICLVLSVPVAGVFLSSLYIHELWSGVMSAELFLSHVNMVTKHETKKQGGSRWTLSDSAVRSICNDIVRKSNYS